MDFSELTNWYDNFEKHYIGGNVPIRGTLFSGTKLELYPSGHVSIVMDSPKIIGKSMEERTVSMIRQIFDENPNRTLFVDLEPGEIEKIVNGTRVLNDSDWTWDDED